MSHFSARSGRLTCPAGHQAGRADLPKIILGVPRVPKKNFSVLALKTKNLCDSVPEEIELTKSFVDIIHSNGGTGLHVAIFEPLGDVDFYPNGGRDMPGCSWCSLTRNDSAGGFSL